MDAHLRNLERDGVIRDGKNDEVCSTDKDVADGPAFLDLGREDRLQFRLIVSAEEGVALSDLRQTTRSLMDQVDADLSNRLDGIAVDHHTGLPYTHILLRGVTDDGKMRNIAEDDTITGVRERASEIVTLQLGRQTPAAKPGAADRPRRQAGTHGSGVRTYATHLDSFATHRGGAARTRVSKSFRTCHSTGRCVTTARLGASEPCSTTRMRQ